MRLNLIEAKLTGTDGANVDTDVQVGPVNLWLHALFLQVELFLNNKVVTSSTTPYSYRVHIEMILNFKKDAEVLYLTSALLNKDKAGKVNLVNPLVGGETC